VDDVDAVGQGSDDQLQAAVRELEHQVELSNILFQSFSGNAKSIGRLTEIAVEIEISHALHDDCLLYRFDVQCRLRGGEGKHEEERPEYGEIDLRLVCEFQKLGGLTVSDETIERFGDTVALRIVGPYIREAISSMVVRLGFPALTIGMFTSGEAVPRTITGRRMTR
jgi:hypothetical protein